MPSPTHAGAAAHPRIPVGLIIRVVVAAVVIAAVVLLISGSHETETVSGAIDRVHRLALARPAGSAIGSWWVSALSYDAETHRLTDFKMESDAVRIAAPSARVIVDPHSDSFQIEMWDVVVESVPREGVVSEHDPLELDRYLLGPIPYGKDIVPDGRSKSPR